MCGARSSFPVQCTLFQVQHCSPVHKCMITQQAVRDCGFIQLDHPAYSHDRTPNDYYLLTNLKSHLVGICYSVNESHKAMVSKAGRTDIKISF